jgi:hypothetical protein
MITSPASLANESFEKPFVWLAKQEEDHSGLLKGVDWQTDPRIDSTSLRREFGRAESPFSGSAPENSKELSRVSQY